MSGLIMLASYPKSGNTWVRAFLTSAWSDGGPVDINHIRIANCADRHLCAHYVGINTSELTAAEIVELRPRALEFAARNNPHSLYLKIHDAWAPQIPGVAYPAPADHIRKVLYIVRDPREVVISFGNHLGISIDACITAMANPCFQLGLHPNGRRPQLPQRLSTWSAHLESWTEAFHDRLLLVRYEDLSEHPEREFGRILDFLEMAGSPGRLRRAVEAVRFRTLQRAEQTNGFVERPPGADAFFRAGSSSSWKEILSAAQLQQIRCAHGSVMSRLGYV